MRFTSLFLITMVLTSCMPSIWRLTFSSAQAAAALVGYYDRHVAPGQPVRPGLLLGTRKLDLKLERFEAGRTYRIAAENAFSDSDAASFVCSIEDDTGATVATANLNAYRPPDMENFLKEQMKT